jgi:hypothetical protein
LHSIAFPNGAFAYLGFLLVHFNLVKLTQCNYGGCPCKL